MTLVDMLSAVEHFCDTWGSGHLSCDLADKLTCIEADAIAELLEVLGYEQSAEQWIRDHSWGDDCGDLHCRCVECHPHEHIYAPNPHYCEFCGKEQVAQQSSERSTGSE